jgi:hypothetical protein
MQQFIDGYIPVQRQVDGLFPFPRTRYGILPYHRAPHQILWGVVETNRLGPVIFTPAAGTQDLIAISEKHSMTLELSKPVKDYSKHQHASFLKNFAGQALRDEVYQQVLNCLEANGYKLFFENPMQTAIHEAYEEHGLDLRLMVKSIEQAFFKCTPAAKGQASLCLWMPQLQEITAIKLRHTQKVEEKIRRNHGRVFYEKGAWVTLNELKTRHEVEQSKVKQEVIPILKQGLVRQVLTQFQEDIQLIEMMEAKFKPSNSFFAKARASETASFLTQQSLLFNLFA